MIIKLLKKINSTWDELGLSDLKTNNPDPSLFGYVMNEVIKLNHMTNL